MPKGMSVPLDKRSFPILFAAVTLTVGALALAATTPGLGPGLGPDLGLGWLHKQGMSGQGDTLTVLDPTADTAQAQQALSAAQQEGEAARQRAQALEAQARKASAELDRTARQAAAVAARIQQNEAALAAQQARIAMLSDQRRQLRARMAREQAPLIRLTGALQRLSRRPPLLALLRPGSVRDAVYTRALLDTLLPEVHTRTIALRAQIAKGRALQAQARTAQAQLAQTRAQLARRRVELASLESHQRLASRAASGIAARESDRALALAEKARDLSGLVDIMGQQGELRAQLAALPGPVMRPADPQASHVIDADSFTPPPAGLTSYMLPIAGRVVTGFGEMAPGQPRSSGLTLETRPQAQAVAPAAGRVAYAARYRGFGNIVIIEHASGWTSLVTGLARLDVAVGDVLVAGAPIGQAGPGQPRIMVELRHDSVPVNPLHFIRAL